MAAVKILAAEDTPSLRALLQLCLERAGHQVDIAENGKEALDRFAAGAYDAVILDLQMPVMDGLEAVRAIRALERERGAAPGPILALSANTEGADFMRCLEAGFTAAVRKPFGREELLSAVAKHAKPDARPAPAGPIVVEADPDFAALIPPFLVFCRDEAEAMRRSLEAGDFAPAVAASHKIVGAGASYGFAPLSDECRALEAAAKNGDAAGALARLDAVDAYLAAVKVVYR
jgi:CheY-like chemotaxis protein